MAGNLDLRIRTEFDNSSALAKLRQLKDELNSLRDHIKSTVTEVKIKITAETANINSDIQKIKDNIKTKLGQNEAKVKVEADPASITSSAARIKNQLRTALGIVPISLEASINTANLTTQVSTIRTSINSAIGTALAIKINIDRPHLLAQLASARSTINNFFITGINAIRLNLSLTPADLAAARARITTLSGAKVKVHIDLAYLNSQITLARSMIGSLGGNLNINIDATAGNLIAALNNLRTSVDHLRAAMGSGGGNGGGAGAGSGGGLPILAGMGGQLAGLLGGFVGITGVITAFHKVISSQREFDILNAQLVTATKSTEGAKEAFAVLQDFAKKTPYDLKQAVDGFSKLVNLGLTPSERALKSYGNTSAAMGKDLMQFIEAVADASTSEFERLKEFGIKAKQNGDQVSLTFQGVTKTIGNNAKEIEEYLIAIGENEFAGAMEKRVDTLDGALASLGDTWDGLFRAISDLGLGDLIKDSVKKADDSIGDLIELLQSGAVESALGGMGKAFSVFSDNTKSDMESIASAFSGLGEYLVSSWRSTITEMNDLGNIFNTARSYVQKAAVGVAAGVDIVTDPFNKRTTNEQKNANYKSSIADIDAQKNARVDAVKRGFDQAELLREYQRLLKEEEKKHPKDNVDRLAKFKIPSQGNAPKSDKDDKKKERDSKKAAEAAAKEAEALERARYENQKALVEIQMQQNEDKYRAEEIQQDTYFANRETYIKRIAEIERQEFERRAAAEKKGSAKQKDETEKAKLTADEQSKLSALNLEKKKADEQRKKDEAQLQIDLAQAEGKTYSARIQEIEQKYGTLIENLKAQAAKSDISVEVKVKIKKKIEILEEIKKQETAKTKLDKVDKDTQKILSTQRDDETLLEQKRAKNPWQGGAIDSDIKQSKQTAATQLRQQLDILNLPEFKAIEGIDEKIRALNISIGELEQKAPTALQEFQTSLQETAITASTSGLSNFFMDLVDGTKSAKDALKDFARSFIASIARMATEALAKIAIFMLLNSLTGGAFAGSGMAKTTGFGGMETLFTKQHHDGGVVGKDGKDRLLNANSKLSPNEIPAILEKGEEVLTRDDPRHRHNFDPAAHMLSLMPKYHIGGIAGNAPGEVPAILQAGEAAFNENNARSSINGRKDQDQGLAVKIVNAIQGSAVLDHVASPEGAKVILNIIGENMTAIKSRLDDG